MDINRHSRQTLHSITASLLYLPLYSIGGILQKGIENVLLTELPVESFLLPITTYTQSHFVTARAAARRMVKQGHGAIVMHTPNASRISPPFVGGLVPLEELTNAAVFVASDEGSATTGTIFNLTAGMIV
jgi:hypothetical protein